MADSSEEKDLPASDKKLRDARQKGQVAKSTEFVTACVTLMGFGYINGRVVFMASHFIDILQATGDAAAQPLNLVLHPLAGRIGLVAAEAVLPLLLLIVVAVIAASVFATGGPVLSFHPLMPNFGVLNPISGFKKMFSVRKLLDMVKNVLKLVAVGTLSIILIRSALQPLVEQPGCGLSCAPAIMAGTLRPLLLMGSIFFVVVGVADIGVQKWLFARDQRMTKTEVKQETKNSEGDPHIKAAFKRIQKEAAQSRMGMRQATFAIMGTGDFVALRYSSADTRVPTIVARGEDDKATELLQDARKRNIPVFNDSDVARSLIENIRLGHPIDKDHFQPVIMIMKALELI